MIDRAAREHLALFLRRLADGRITNDDFDDHYPVKSQDRGVVAVSSYGWGLYSDYHNYRLVLPKLVLRRVAVGILFLHSDVEYEWPQVPASGRWGSFLAALTLGRFDLQEHNGAWSEWYAAGDRTVWPFLRWADFDRALAEPRFFTGRSFAAA